METKPPDPTAKKPKGLPLWTALLAMLVLAVVAVTALGFLLYHSRSKQARADRELKAFQTQQAQRDLEQQKAGEQAKLDAARNRQEQVLAQARQATNALEQLSLQLQRLTTEAAALKTSDAGRTVALHPDLVAQARRFYETTLPALATPAEVTTRLEGARRVQQQLLAAMGTTFQPQADQSVTLQNSTLWAEQEARKVNDAYNLLSGLVRESQVKVTDAKLTPASPTLAAAVNNLAEAEAAWRQRTMLEQTARATTNAVAVVADAESERIKKRAELEATNTLLQVTAAQAAQARTTLVQQAESKLEDAKTQVVARDKLDEALRVELRQKASDPQLQGKLAPFITPGHWQIGGIKPELKPHSLTALRSYGALEPTLRGMDRLVEVACKAVDHVRPRWKLERGRDRWSKSPQDMAKVKEAQELLIELGPVLVEMKLLEP